MVLSMKNEEGLATSEGIVSKMPIVRQDDLIHNQLSVMRKQEATTYCCRDYLASYKEADIDGSCRRKMADWFFQLADFCHVSRNNVAVAMDFLDRFLSTATPGPDEKANDRARKALEDRQEYQLAAMTCLYLAININETKEIDTRLLSVLSHGKYSKMEFVEMAEVIMFGLNWHLNGPTAIGIVSYLLEMLPLEVTSSGFTTNTLKDLCQMQTEFSLQDYRFVTLKPSIIATASICNAMREIDHAEFSKGDRLQYLQSLVSADMDPFSEEVEMAMGHLRKTFNASMDGLRQVTSLVRLGDHDEKEVECMMG